MFIRIICLRNQEGWIESVGGATGQNTRGTLLCHWRAREPGCAWEVKVRGVPPVVLTVSKVEGPCADSRGYEWDSKDGDDQRGWEDAMGSGGMSSRERGGQSGGPLTSVSVS